MAQSVKSTPQNVYQGTMPRIDVSSLIVSAFICFAIAFAFILASDNFIHWFIIPVTLCGIVIGADAINWMRGRVGLFDPRGLLGLFGVHFFFLAPLLHVLWDYQLLYITPLDDWRSWLGSMAFLNLAGLFVYNISRRWVRIPQDGKANIKWQLNARAALIALYFSLSITAGLQAYVFWQFGGIEAFANISPEQARGWGFVFTFSESFPILAMIAFVVFARSRPALQSWFAIGAALAIFFLIRLIFFGGLSGSRSSTLFALIWALCVVHLYLRAVPRRFIYFGIIASIFFIYLGGLYKSYGTDFAYLIEQRGISAIPQLLDEANRGVEEVLIEDLGRVSVQSFMLFRLTEEFKNNDFPYALGQTYLAGLVTPIPSAIFPNKPLGRLELGTLILEPQGLIYGAYSSRVYALAGEALLNFGWVGVPFVFGFWGLAVAWVRRWMETIPKGDARLLLLPLLLVWCFLILTADSDLNAIYLVRQGIVPFVIVWFSSRRIDISSEPQFGVVSVRTSNK